jgi:hypothetical protein
MKIIKYKFLSCEVNRGTEENPDLMPVFLFKEICCPTDEIYEANLLIAQNEAYNGEYTVEGENTEETSEPTLDDRVLMLEETSAEMSEALALILSGVTE